MTWSTPTVPDTRSQEPTAPSVGITVYGCGQDEAVLFRQMAPRYGATPTLTDAAVSEANIGLAFGNRCVSIGHKSRLSEPILLALGRAGVQYVSTRSVGYDHIDVACAARAGISVENVAYSPDGVADYTMLLMLMVVRNAKSTISRAQVHDYRLHDQPGRELRDLTVGVVGAGRIGVAVMDRLRGFGCRVLAFDRCRSTSAEYVTLEVLLRESDVVTLHAPLTADTHHLLDRRRIELMLPRRLHHQYGTRCTARYRGPPCVVGERPSRRRGAGRRRTRGRSVLLRPPSRLR